MLPLNDTVATAAQEITQFTFNAADYVVFTLMLCISTAIGLYFGFFAHSADTTDEYLLGGKKMKTLPVAISLVASQLSAISIMTIPAEMYTFGINWFFNVASTVIHVPVLCWVVIPVFYNNNISNCYEYLEIRFNRATRQILTIAFMVTLFFIMPVYLFIPSLAFSQVTGLNIHLINTIVCSICIFYTMIGGIKAVVWTDVAQAAIMVASVTLIGVMGAMKIGGFGEVFRIAAEGHRLDVNFAFDATTRTTFWNISISSIILWSSYVGLNQSCVQRIVSLPSLGHAQRSLVIFGFGFFLIMLFCCFSGITMYARYHDCDPLLAGFVEKADKLMPYFVQDVVGHLTGMPGIFISCVFSAALSTMSASLNSLAGIVYFDYIKPHIRHTEHKGNVIMKIFICCCGVYCILGGVIVQKFSSILQIVYSIGGVTFGSVFGVFFMGMLVPKAHGRAAFWSVVISMLAMLIIIIGAQGRLHYKALPTTIEGCTHNISSVSTNTSTLLHLSTIATTTTTATTTAATALNADEGFNIFEMSFNWYTVLGAVIMFSVGIPLSYILPPGDDHKFDPKLLSPVVQSFFKYELARQDEENEMKMKSKTKTILIS